MRIHLSPHKNNAHQNGMVLIFVAGILAILAAMGTAFFALSQTSTSAAVRYSDMVRADLLCRAGLAEAIVRLRNQAYIKTEDPGDNWFTVDYMRGARRKISFPFCDGKDNEVLPLTPDGIVDNEGEPEKGYTRQLSASIGEESDRFFLEVNDAASKININAGDNLGVILDNLCRVIGPPLVPANLDALQPRRWGEEADASDAVVALYETSLNVKDEAANGNIYYATSNNRPVLATDGTALYGDGYAIAGYRGENGAFRNIEDVKRALTYVERNGNNQPDDPIEQMEIEIKFAALRDHITIGSWVDINTVCVGKFEWVKVDTTSGKTYAIDRDKSWVKDDPVADPLNTRGSLRGSYLSIMNGHGAGQLRRILSNGIDWVEVDGGFAVTPGPISSYMIIAKEDALLEDVTDAGGNLLCRLPKTYPDPANPGAPFPDGTLVDDPAIDYAQRPLCIHRAPVNINTATDKVLAALFLGINVQHGHPLALGTDADVPALRTKWKTTDPHEVQPYLLTPAGLKRIPAASGKPILNKVWGTNVGEVHPPPALHDAAYISNYNMAGAASAWGTGSTGVMSEAQELAYRIIMARQSDRFQPSLKYIDPVAGIPTITNTGVLRGPFRNYDDLYFRVIKPWDEQRFTNGAGHCARLSTMLMANFNSNTDILKFNPNIEWIDRWSRNYTDQEPVMVYTNEAYPPGNIFTTDVPAATTITASSVPIYTGVTDTSAGGWGGTKVPPLHSSQKSATNHAACGQCSGCKYIVGAYVTRSFRYKSDELIDKTDLNRSTTEFSFDSNGIFQVTSSGQVINPATGQLLSERRLEALVKVYDVWRESTQQQFVTGTLSKACGDRTRSTDRTELSCTGQLARDASGLVERKGLTTLPEPLLPLKAKIVDIDGDPNPRNFEAVSGVTALNNTWPVKTGSSWGAYDPLDAFGKKRENPYDDPNGPRTPAIDVPEVLANRVLPARWDGQIILSTNTSSYDPSTNGDADSFLASFDGDTDTATCEGNGREQAKWPYSAKPDPADPAWFTYTGEGNKYRCVQSIGLLGVLNDTMVSTDPGIPLVNGSTPFKNWADKDQVRWIYPFYGVSAALMPLSLGADLERPMYWNNLSVRMGALRTDGVYLTAPGVSGNTATLKYLYSPTTASLAATPTGAASRHDKLNFQPDSKNGNLITMWAKTVWHHDDMRSHEFFNPGNEARINQCEIYYFTKIGQYKWCSANESTGLGSCGNRRELNDLLAIFTYREDSGYGSALHGGFAGITVKDPPDPPESPAYRVQPFRWSYVGLRTNYGTTSDTSVLESIGPRGHLATSADWQSSANRSIIRHYIRPFIDTALFPEGPANWPSAATGGDGEKLRWSYRGCTIWGSRTPNVSKAGDSRDVVDSGTSSIADRNPTRGGREGEGQDVKWVWAEPYGGVALDPAKSTYSLKSFGLNNLNFGNPNYQQNFAASTGNNTVNLMWHFRHMPEDGTYAVIDELKISNRDEVLVDNDNPKWNKDRAYREMRTSRYYLPPSPGTRLSPGAGGPPTFTSQTLLQSLKGYDSTSVNQSVAVVRANWNVFTPRFMSEYQLPGLAPFSRQERLTHFDTTTSAAAYFPVDFKGPFDYVRYNDNADTSAYGVNRPAPWSYPGGLSQANRGVEIELLNDTTPLEAKQQDSTLVFQDATTNPVSGTKSILTNPAVANRFGDLMNPVRVPADKLRYRVRFRYPVDPLADPSNAATDVDGKPCVDTSKHYLLDTPVFDDISVTYILPVRILDFREVTE